MILSEQRESGGGGVFTIHFGNPIKGAVTSIIRTKNTELPSYTKALPSFFKCVFRKCEVLIQCLQSFPFKITYWTLVSVFKGSSTKFQYFIYKFKEFSRKKSISRSFQGPSSFFRGIPGPCKPYVMNISFHY